MPSMVIYMGTTCSGVPGIHIRCDGWEALRRLGQLIASMQQGTVARVDLLAELPAETDGVESCILELAPAERESRRSVVIDRGHAGGARVHWRHTASGWSDCLSALRVLVVAADRRLIQTFPRLRDDLEVVEAKQD